MLGSPVATRVGPHGYIHGWIFVGVPATGARVFHPHHGTGTVTSLEGKHAKVRFASGAEHSFEVKPGAGEGRLVPRGTAFYGALQPREWSPGLRQEALDGLGEKSRDLADTLAEWQDGKKIAGFRVSVSKYVNGEHVDQATRRRIDALFGAIRDAPDDLPPGTLYRGMSLEGAPEALLDRYGHGKQIDLNLSSFTDSREIANEYPGIDLPRGHTRVIMELAGSKKALPIQNLSQSQSFFDEHEWIAAGRFKVVAARQRGSRLVILEVRQVKTL